MTPEQHARAKALFIRLDHSNNSYNRYQVTNPFPEYIREDGEYMESVDTPELDKQKDDDPEYGYNHPRSCTVSYPPPSLIPGNPLRRPVVDKPSTPGPSNAGDFDDAQQPQDMGKGREVEQDQEPDNEEPENGDNGGGD
jgi:hypothetical protein